jgi:uncharacterized metal-binding protein YceD (DUF177 family)
MSDFEFSRPVTADRIGTNWATYDLDATEAERAALARRFGLIAIDRLVGQARLKRGRGGEVIEFQAHLEASVRQACIVSLEPVPEEIDEDFSLDFASYPDGEGPDDHDLEAPEPIENGVIDLGEVLAQQLALALDPYPRAAGAEIPDVYRGDPEATDTLDDPENKPNPFAALEALKKR